MNGDDDRFSLGGSACSSIVCSHGAKCLIDSNDLARCYCPEQCHDYARTISIEGRVCGSDNETYQSLCDLQKKACQRQENLNVAHAGDCRTFSSRSSSFFSRSSKENDSFEDCQSHLPCPTEYRPICASNLQEYVNECEMNRHACQSKIHLSKLHDGPCDFYEQQRKLEGNEQKKKEEEERHCSSPLINHQYLFDEHTNERKRKRAEEERRGKWFFVLNQFALIGNDVSRQSVFFSSVSFHLSLSLSLDLLVRSSFT